MNDKIKILFLEDNEADAELNTLELIKAGFKFTSKRVETRDQFIQSLGEFNPDIIIADYSLPSFDGMEALRIVQEIKIKIPFIFVTGTLGEELAVETVKRGATDYVLKQNLTRLGSSVKRALQEIAEIEKREAIEEKLIISETRYRRLFESAKDGILIIDAETGNIIDVNPFLVELLGYSFNEFIGKQIWEIGLFKDIIDNQTKFLELKQNEYVRYEDLPLETKDGRKIDVEFVSNAYKVNNYQVIQCNIRNITERKLAEKALRINEEIFRNFMEHSPIFVFFKDKNIRAIRLSKNYESMFGKPMTEILGKTMYDLFPSELAQRMVADDTKIFKEGKEITFDEEFNGRFYTTIKFPINIDGKPRYLAGYTIDITERKQAEEALRESERFAQNTVNALDINMAILNKDGVILAVNNAWRSFNKENNGDPARSNEGVNYLEICDNAKGENSDEAAEIAAGIRAVIAGEKDNYKLEYPCNSPSTQRWIILSVNRFHGDGPVSVVISHTNITDRKIAENELKFRNILLITQQDTSLDSILVIDRNGVIISYNKRFMEMWGISSEEMETKSSKYILHSTSQKMINPEQYTENVNFLSTHTSETSHDEINLKDGRYFERYSAPMIGSDGIYYGRVWYFHDLTSRKKSEEELENYRDHLEQLVKERTNDLALERNLLRTLIDSLPDEIYAKDKDSRYIIANSNVVHSFVRTKIDEIIGKTDFELLPQKAAMKFYSTEHAVLLAKGNTINYEESIRDPDGSLRWYSITKVPLRDNEGNISGLVGINRDISNFKNAEESLKQAKEEAENANRAKSTFLSSMSHEIRTPMNAILGFSELMLYDKNLTKEQIQWIKTINRSGEHLLVLINDILEISRIEAGRIVFNPSGFDLHSLLRDIEAMFRIKTDEKNLSLLFEYSDELPKYIISDESKLRQIIINLVGNAAKFTKEGGVVVRSRVKQINDKMYFIAEVEDTGPGIAEKDIDKLFQKFWQAEAGIREGGTGLGLAISQQYARIMVGEITVKSVEGKGTCFTLTIEIENSEPHINDKNYNKPVTGLLPGQKKYRILVADDHADNRDLLKIMLTSVGFEVEEAQNGNETIAKFKIWLPDLILMDMQMPVMDGYTATSQIKAMENGNIPIIAVTASAFNEDRQKALKSGADTYLRKPFKEHELFESIEFCLGVKYIYE